MSQVCFRSVKLLRPIWSAATTSARNVSGNIQIQSTEPVIKVVDNAMDMVSKIVLRDFGFVFWLDVGNDPVENAYLPNFMIIAITI